MIECPDCDYSDEDYNTIFEHRVKNHTDAGDGDSFNLYDDDVFTIFNELAVHRAIRRIEEDNPSVERLKTELRRMGVSVGFDENINPVEEYAE